jgi:DNA-binding response OmpR family regulator
MTTEAGMDVHCILIVESDVLIRHPLAEYLRDCGYRVIEATDGREARTFLAEAKVDIVLANVNAPKESGFTLATWIRANYSTVEVILVGTVATAVEKAGDLCAEGPTPASPYDHKLVHDRIRQLLAGRARPKKRGRG